MKAELERQRGGREKYRSRTLENQTHSVTSWAQRFNRLIEAHITLAVEPLYKACSGSKPGGFRYALNGIESARRGTEIAWHRPTKITIASIESHT